MDNVRTTLPATDVTPKLRMNVLRVISEHLPYRLAEIAEERLELQRRLDNLTQEEATLLRVQAATLS